MIVYKEWSKFHKDVYGGHYRHYIGWFLFGIIPLYIKRKKSMYR